MFHRLPSKTWLKSVTSTRLPPKSWNWCSRKAYESVNHTIFCSREAALLLSWVFALVLVLCPAVLPCWDVSPPPPFLCFWCLSYHMSSNVRTLSIMSWNVRGLGDLTKRPIIFNSVSSAAFSVVLFNKLSYTLFTTRLPLLSCRPSSVLLILPLQCPRAVVSLRSGIQHPNQILPHLPQTYPNNRLHPQYLKHFVCHYQCVCLNRPTNKSHLCRRPLRALHQYLWPVVTFWWFQSYSLPLW